jgi:hypothetical protein
MVGMSWISEQPLGSQEGPCSKELPQLFLLMALTWRSSRGHLHFCVRDHHRWSASLSWWSFWWQCIPWAQVLLIRVPLGTCMLLSVWNISEAASYREKGDISEGRTCELNEISGLSDLVSHFVSKVGSSNFPICRNDIRHCLMVTTPEPI